MATSFIRIHNAEGRNGEPATVIGASRSEIDLFGHPKFQKFLEDNDLVARNVPGSWSPRGGISSAYLEVQPPLSDDQLHELGAICVGGNYNGKPRIGLVDEGYVVDNRNSDPRHYNPSDVIAPRYA